MKQFSKFLSRVEGDLFFDGGNVNDLAREHGTPLYVLSDSALEANLAEIQTEFVNQYANVLPLYASKALSIKHVYQKVQQFQLGVDVVSSGEIFVALQAGIDPQKIYFHGSNKSKDEIEYAITNGVTHFIVDNFHEIELLQASATTHGINVQAMLRIVPQVKAGGHSYIQTGAIDTKFGFSTHDTSFLTAIEQVMAAKQLEFIGIHCHTGSQIMEVTPFLDTAAVMADYALQIYDTYGVLIPELNIGGGYGIVYEPGQQQLSFKEIIHPVMQIIEQKFAARQLTRPKILIEPGRSIVGNAMVTLYSIGSSKTIPEVRKYVSIDGGMADNIRPSLYQATYHAFVGQERPDATMERVTIAGKCCESGDILIKDITLPTLCAGDILAIPSTGAYNYSMSSNYNQLLRPAMIAVKEGRAREIIRRQTYEDLITCENE